jgi:hypothetical protein
MKFSELVEKVLYEKKEIAPYDIQIPPRSKKECLALMNKASMANEEWTMMIKGKEVKMPAKEAFKKMNIATIRHETVHAMQELNIPGILKKLPSLDGKAMTSEANKKKYYYTRHPEIMAYAYDTAMGVNAEKTKKIYQSIGGREYELFVYYLESYKKSI